MLLALAWRNVWRNARRSLITMSALTVGVAGIVGFHSYRENIYAVMVHDLTAGLLGHLQVHALGYQEAPSIGLLVKNPVQVEAAMHGALPGATTERRVLGAGLAGSGEHSAPVMVLGLEASSTGLYHLATGQEPGAHQVLLGKDLASELEVQPGGELVLLSQAADGSVANDRYTVAGTFTSISSELDTTGVVMSLGEAQSFFSLGEGVHQVVVRLPRDEEDVSLPLDSLRAALDLKSVEALSWNQMMPELKASMDSKRKSQGAMDFIIFLIVGLGVFNAMTMAVFERTRELGVLASLGTRPSRLLAMVLLESLLQGVLAYVAGVALAAAVLYSMGTSDLSSMLGGDVMGTRLPGSVKLELLPAALKAAGVTAFMTALVGALIPAARAARMQPVEAVRQT